MVSIQVQLALQLDGIVAQCEERVKALFQYATDHPQADLAQLEEQAQRLSQDCFAPALAALLVAQARQVKAERGCQCGGKWRYKGEHRRRLETCLGPVVWERSYYYCHSCGQGYYPLDEAMAIGRGQFSEGVEKRAARLAARLPFAAAAEELWQLTGTNMSARQVERVSEGRGLVLEERESSRREQWRRGEEPGRSTVRVKAAGQKWALSLDATTVRFGDGWHEVKAGVVFGVRARREKGQVVGGQASQQSYLAQVGSLEEAGERLYGEAIRRGIDVAQEEVICLADGAPGNWNQFALHFPHRVEILDWWHALEHLWAVGSGLFGQGKQRAKEWVEQKEGWLWEGRVEEVIAALEEQAQGEGGEAAAKEVGYFRANRERMRYDQYRSLGYPIASGTVESACKRVVGARLKGAGMCWSREGAQGLLNLRCALLNGRWQEAWQDTRPLPKAA